MEAEIRALDSSSNDNTFFIPSLYLLPKLRIRMTIPIQKAETRTEVFLIVGAGPHGGGDQNSGC
jgi:hypothetical protein